jgi:hypothetical protein
MIRADKSKMRWIEVGGILLRRIRKEMDKGRGYTELMIRRSKSRHCVLCATLCC